MTESVPSQCFSTFVRPRPGKFFFIRRGPGTNKFTCKYLSNFFLSSYIKLTYVKGKAVPLQAWRDPEVSRKLRFPDFMTTAQDGCKFVSLTHRPPLPPGNTPGTHFCQRLSRPQGNSATRRIMSLKTSNDTIGNRTCDLSVCSVVT